MEFMRLQFREFPVGTLQFGPATALTGTTLSVNKSELVARLLADGRLAAVDVDIARPGESCRIIHVQDVIQPRAKIAGDGTVFPGFAGSGRTVGSGVTHALTGMAVVSCGEVSAKSSSQGPSSVSGPRNRLLDMSGPGAAFSPFAQTLNLVLTYVPAPGLSPVEYEAAMRLGSLQTAEYLAAASRGQTPASEELLTTEPVPGLPRVVYIAQVHNEGFLRDTWFLGEPLPHDAIPTILHPNELMDGIVVNASLGYASISTYAFQDNQVVRELYRRHGRDLNFAGVVLTTRHHHTDTAKERKSWFVAKLAKQLGADGVVLTQEGGGNSIIDQMLCCQACEALGIRTTVVSHEMGGPEGKDFPLIYFVPEAVAIASTGNREERVQLPAVERALGGRQLLYSDAPATAQYLTPVSDIAFAIDLSGFWRMRAYDY